MFVSQQICYILGCICDERFILLMQKEKIAEPKNSSNKRDSVLLDNINKCL
jgi:hypothetical protein